MEHYEEIVVKRKTWAQLLDIVFYAVITKALKQEKCKCMHMTSWSCEKYSTQWFLLSYRQY